MNSDKPILLGLRVDVDTFRGTRDGVPNLLRILKQNNIQASFFFTVGPDNMGRHLWRLLKPAFLLKMLRSNAASLYGWDILLRGTLWPGPLIGQRLAHIIKNTEYAGHEIGLHAWDHHRWQAKIDTMDPFAIKAEIEKGMQTLNAILDRPVSCSAAAGWKCTPKVLEEKNAYALNYNSDCRGKSIFRPLVNGQPGTAQIPVTLPTYDEIVGHNNIDDTNYNEHILNIILPEQLNVLTIHAEVEGISKQSLFNDFLQHAKARNIHCVPLGHLLHEVDKIPSGKITLQPIDGREGTVCWQSS